MLQSWSRVVHRRPKTVLAASILVLLASGVSLALPGELSHHSAPADAESTEAARLIEAQVQGGHPRGFTLVFSHGSWSAHEEPFVSELLAAVAPLRRDPRAEHVQTPYDHLAHGGQGGHEPGDAHDPMDHHDHSLISTSGRHALVLVTLSPGVTGVHEQAAAYRELRALVASDALRVQAADDLAVSHAYMDALAEDLVKAELLGLPVVLVLLLVVFGTAVAAVLPLGVGILAVAGGLGGTFLLARYTDVSMYATNVVTLIGLGVAIDYSLFIVSRFREERASLPPAAALERTMHTAGRAVLFSGLTVAVGLLGLTFYSGLYFASMGLGGAIVVAFAVVYALSFLPALLVLLGPRLDRLRVPWARRERPGRGAWGRLARFIMGRPGPVLVGAVALVALAAAPFAGIHLSSSDVEALPASHEVRQAADLLEREFPQRGDNVHLVVARFPGDPLTPERVGALHDASRAIRALPGVAGVESIVDLPGGYAREDYMAMYAPERETFAPPLSEAVARSMGETVVVMLVRASDAPGSDAARELVRQIRAMPPVDDGELLVTGPTAYDLDIVEVVKTRTPLAVGFVVAATFVLVLLQTGSLVLPLKAVAMNVLSIGASFGALVWIFQEGHFSGLLGFTPAPIDPSVPVLLFCIVFGLSMDYEVLMLSRMHEEYERTRDNTRAVADGLEKSGRLITSAALLMVVVFAAFATSQVTVIKAIGVGLALAIALDATLVRGIIVPAAMRLMGEANWWAPEGLRRMSALFREG